MRHTQKVLQTDTAVLLEKLLHMFASFGRSALLKPRRERLQAIGRRSVYYSRRIALSSPNSSCAQENSAYGTSLFIRDILCRVPHLCTFSNTLSATASHSSGVHRNERVTKDARNVS